MHWFFLRQILKYFEFWKSCLYFDCGTTEYDTVTKPLSGTAEHKRIKLYIILFIFKMQLSGITEIRYQGYAGAHQPTKIISIL